MPDDNRGRGNVDDDETVVPLLTVETGLDLATVELEEHMRSNGSEPYKSRNDEFRGRSYRKRTPLPLLQIFVLSVTRLSEPVAYTQIFPYINQMMEDLKVTNKRSEIGYFSGVVDSIFAVCQLFTILQWGRLSDRIGRKPVILLGLSGVALSTALFGLSKSFWWAVIARSMAGALSGNAAVVQSVVGEITDETNQAIAFPLTGLSWSFGCIIGPMIGGNFANPFRSLPNSFGKIPLLQEYPYLLPCIVSASLTVITIVFGGLFLKETLPSKLRLDPSLPSPISAKYSEKVSPSASREELSVKSILSCPTIRAVFRNYFLLSVSGTSFDVVFILLSYTPVHLGGLSRTPDEIGYALAFSGMVGSVIQVFVFPWLQRTFDNIRLYRLLMALWPILFAILPFLSVLARWSAPPEVFAMANISDVAGSVEGSAASTTYPAGTLLWTGIGIALAILRLAHMCYALNTILTRNAAPSKEALGATFGLAQTVACVARAGSPAFVSTLFAMSKKYNILGGTFVWIVMFIIAMLGWYSTLQLKESVVDRSYKNPPEESEMRMLSS